MTTCIRRPHTVWSTCPCDDCKRDHARLKKHWSAGLYRRVSNEEAVAILRHLRDDLGWTAHAIASAAGMSYRSVDRNLEGARIGPKAARSLVEHGDPTAGSVFADGTRRRLQGLAWQCYDLRTIADATGIRFSTLAAIRNGATERVRSTCYTTIRDYTRQVGMSIGPSIGARQHAERVGWVSLIAWDEGAIDDPKARPHVGSGKAPDYDEAVVLRLLDGEKVPSRKVERDEALRRWVAAGRSAKSLEDMHGWKNGRYGRVAAIA